MLRTMLLFFLLAVCVLFFYQKMQVEEPALPQQSQRLDDSSLLKLRQILPSSIFEKEVQPVLEKNKSSGMTQSQIEEFLKRLETIGKALGDKTAGAITKAIEELAPEGSGIKGAGVKELLDQGVAAAKENMPTWKSAAEGLLNGLGSALSRLLDCAASILQDR